MQVQMSGEIIQLRLSNVEFQDLALIIGQTIYPRGVNHTFSVRQDCIVSEQYSKVQYLYRKYLTHRIKSAIC